MATKEALKRKLFPSRPQTSLRFFTELDRREIVKEVVVQVTREIKEILPSMIPAPIKGNDGPSIEGKRGSKGETIIGPEGLRGLQGEKGGKGPRGFKGIAGTNAIDGKDGIDGISPELPDFEEMFELELEKFKREVRRRQPARQISGGGGDSMSFTNISDNTTLKVNAKLSLVDATNGNITLTLPPASQGARREYHIKKVDSTANTVTITPQGSSKIDGETSVEINFENTNCRLYSDGSNWYQL